MKSGKIEDQYSISSLKRKAMNTKLSRQLSNSAVVSKSCSAALAPKKIYAAMKKAHLSKVFLLSTSFPIIFMKGDFMNKNNDRII